MAETEFRFIHDEDEYPWTVEQTARGIVVVRHGKIQAADPVAAVLHESVPKIGEKYAEGSFLRVVSVRKVADVGGRVGSGDGIHVKLEVRYETPVYGGGGVLSPTAPGDSWTEWGFGTAALQVYDEVGLELPEGIVVPPLNNGDGVSRDVGTIEATVKVWYNRAGFGAENHARMVELSEGWVNDGPLVLPNLIGSGVYLNMGPGQVRYVSAEYVREGEFFGIFHHLKLARDHKPRLVSKDENGMVDAITTPQIYAPISMDGLW